MSTRLKKKNFIRHLCAELGSKGFKYLDFTRATPVLDTGWSRGWSWNHCHFEKASKDHHSLLVEIDGYEMLVSAEFGKRNNAYLTVQIQEKDTNVYLKNISIDEVEQLLEDVENGEYNIVQWTWPWYDKNPREVYWYDSPLHKYWICRK